MAVKKYKKTTPLVIVDIIINWRLGEDSNSDLDSVDEELRVVKAEASTKTPLKQDNIAPEEVVVSWSYKGLSCDQKDRVRVIPSAQPRNPKDRGFVHVEQKTRSRWL
ncbi:hypothetical protein GLOIN_2v1781669 [Rhizophagus irregularis DAOM 181602=DAOM 197198]|uniref:Uncharacterized protein n=1 Tax=Rhizophagus irregularis (strain DAOM 181602 / DAOM 197198 / MUCL 43194) TaxID=747089 RepID=A0A2P4PJH9_RHIID|nr:hypothetical protein GLOIN_2v1781669 [Rhizophagus irregularis DAOM 181602=DAOM 197198]POG65520.1 hypothetical protein GLOIN_2v1781669 [Rhizophagus irregularis DAOM 181602=DAOM 197198]|eukprot:XP_025172386.1 hypothetical protein GLOIN_2v1781669 [Rhizophagus irregularis DAOM 181602=DAOM 197198]